ncbi:MAG: hypothetical protein NPIRA03_09180 [Nitrospirales bacterium]|nr:MAG: hypothetical protein NPIRA03_09180 [Nitrospirales bacterium]
MEVVKHLAYHGNVPAGRFFFGKCDKFRYLFDATATALPFVIEFECVRKLYGTSDTCLSKFTDIGFFDTFANTDKHKKSVT